MPFILRRMPTHPGEILREEFMIPYGINQVKLAKDLGVTYRTINEIVNEKRSISPEMALKLAKYFGTTPEFWLGLQMKYDLYKASKKADIDQITPLVHGN
ncbi:plasmid maintenance system antidote protein [Deferribacter desulfuricans SSM1]|uniref:Plasmid maintenance system antidote protein n=1 Tax=Deferribacter desulfuricans (strain DSM 14783 / JCM 11476 / NBRC 101012 / SSM1) TaxID=639282 RepID=D3PC74_DEFDS|nr:HigA family addiction module antitoxin [Deferribacter desulfuricans]BAI80197.1 plasmid maintenance system antidote protein [Deferribacter desulfuricans SSM1]